MAAPRKRKAPAAASASPSPASSDGPPALRGALVDALDAVAAVPMFPVRHHSPRVAAAVRAFLDARQPRVVMIEAPRDAAPLVPHLFDADTEPPVAIMAYRTDGPPASTVYPLASYSPEYVALRWAHERGVRIECIDVSSGERLAFDLAHAEEEPPADLADDLGAEPEPDHALALAHGFRDFDELWEAWFEAPAYDAEDVRRLLLAWCQATQPTRRLIDRARDARMARHLAAELERGTSPEHLAVVLGGAHAAALVDRRVEPALEAAVAASVATTTTLIPYSFPRLAAQLGYGAGNRAPRYYQRAYDRRGDYTRATLELLLEFTAHLRLRGFAASLADALEAYRLALTLTALRDKSAPGLDELRDAATATICRGDRALVERHLGSGVIGTTIGKVGARIGRNALQDEFWREVRARGLPATDEASGFALKLADPAQVDASVFLHRLRLADIPYATYQGSHAGAATSTAPADAAGGFDALTRVREHWQAQWTPATEGALVERIVLGDSLVQVTERVLSDRLDAATGAAAAAEVLVEAVVARAPAVIDPALAATERLAATDDDLPSLARTARALSGLCSYRSARGGDDAQAIYAALLARTFARAVLRLEVAGVGSDDAVVPVREAMRVLHELAIGQPVVDGALWFATARELAVGDRLHPACAGLAIGLLYLGEQLGEAEVTALVEQRLSSVVEPRAGAAFLEGFLDVNALVLVRNRVIVAALDEFLQGLTAESFRALAPLLRRAFASLGPTERRYLTEHLLALHAVGEVAAARQVLATRDVETLTALDGELADAMADLEDLL